MSGKTTCKEVCSSCKCTVVEKTIGKEKKDCVATIVGVLSLPESFCKPKDCCEDPCQDKCEDPCADPCEDPCEDPCDPCADKSLCCEEKDECVDVYRDLGECIKKAIVKTSKTC
ncbi:sperm-specific protein Don juan-like [Planococcus citri]|uniref:sperm-specific protein Don juan-like n=1 Tax=Planococcus citri TaxID=170843 RepID=UPI0031F823D6